MKELDKRENTANIYVEPNEGERTLLSSNESGKRSPSLDFDSLIPDNILLDQLASILVDIYLAKIDATRNQKGSDLLPGINKRTS